MISIEDHGYIMSFGLSSKKTGFLLNKNAQQFIKTCNNGALCLFVCVVCVVVCSCHKIFYLGKPLRTGQVISCLILPGANARSVPVTINPDQVRSALVCPYTFLSAYPSNHVLSFPSRLVLLSIC